MRPQQIILSPLHRKCRKSSTLVTDHYTTCSNNKISYINISTDRKQDRQWTITQNWGALSQPMLPWKRNKHYILWVGVYSLRYPVRNAHAPYCHLRSVMLYYIFPHYRIQGTIFVKKIENKLCVLIFTTKFVWNLPHNKKNSVGYYHTGVLISP